MSTSPSHYLINAAGMTNDRVAIIILAAGTSSRMGRPKQSLEVNGKALLLQIAETALASSANDVMVVLGSRSHEHRQIIQHLPVHLVDHAGYEKGMGSSVKAGLKYTLDVNAATTAVVMLVCDQPLLTTAHLDALINTFKMTGVNLVASAYTGMYGVPALFGKSFFPALQHLGDDHGAKKILTANLALVKTIEFPGGEIDLDTPQDFENFTA